MDDGCHDRLAEGLRQGRREAWLALYDAFAEPLWRRVARLMGGDSAAVADVVQATLLAAAESAPHSFDPARGAVWPWLCGVARNQLALYHRRNARDLPVPHAGEPSPGAVDPDDPWARWLAGESDEPPIRAHARELADVVRLALRGMPDEYSDLLLARYVDGTSAEQIAVATGSTGQAVRSKLARARRSFLARLAEVAPSLVAEQGKKP